MYKHGFLFGKFYPPHLGHIYLIEEAAKRCQKLTVIVAALLDEKEFFLSGEIRFNILKEYFESYPNINVCFHQGDEPQYPNEHPHFWNIWLKIILSHIRPEENDVIFSSEQHGNHIAQVLGIKHECIDISRAHVSVSGTVVRDNLDKYWHLLPSETRRHFIKKIAIMGPESVGKSVLTIALAKHFDCDYVPEYGKTYVQRGNQIKQHSFHHIMKAHNADLMQRIHTTNSRVVVVDTEGETTKIFYDLYHPTEQMLNLDLIKTEPIDFRIVIAPDESMVPTQDGTRDFLDRRDEHFKLILNRLQQKNMPHAVLHGNYEKNLADAIKIVEVLLQMS